MDSVGSSNDAPNVRAAITQAAAGVRRPSAGNPKQTKPQQHVLAGVIDNKLSMLLLVSFTYLMSVIWGYGFACILQGTAPKSDGSSRRLEQHSSTRWCPPLAKVLGEAFGPHRTVSVSILHTVASVSHFGHSMQTLDRLSLSRWFESVTETITLAYDVAKAIGGESDDDPQRLRMAMNWMISAEFLRCSTENHSDAFASSGIESHPIRTTFEVFFHDLLASLAFPGANTGDLLCDLGRLSTQAHI